MYRIFQGHINKRSAKDPEKILKLKDIVRDFQGSFNIFRVLVRSLSKLLEDPYRA